MNTSSSHPTGSKAVSPSWPVTSDRSITHPSLPPWKRTLDLTCILLALPAVLLTMALVALVIRICSRGPVLFRQERIGFLSEPFVCLKFRTMHVEADTTSHEAHMEKLIHSTGPMTKLDLGNDARVIPMGGILRATGLDELPQLINVLKGEMSLIGPRPCIPYEYERLSAQDRRRFDAVPGLTGLWQVSGKNGTSFQRMIDLDVQYARNLSLAGDLKILWRTCPVLVAQARAYWQRRAAASAARRSEGRSGFAFPGIHAQATARGAGGIRIDGNL